MDTNECKVCNTYKKLDQFYANDKTCKECRKLKVRENRAKKIEYYRQYDKQRFANDPRVKQRHKKYKDTQNGKDAHNKASKRWVEKNIIKRAAHIIIGNAVRDGRLTPEPCEVCFDTHNVHAHHDDYAKPLEVRWLCAKHHKQWHDENGQGINAS
jgi:hypothetical protein